MSLWEENVLPLRSERGCPWSWGDSCCAMLPWCQACLLLSSWQFGEVWGPKPDLNLWFFCSRFEGIFLVRPPPSLKFTGRHSIWISKMALPFTTRLPSWAIEVAVIFVSPDALQFFRAPLQPGGAGEFTPGSFYERFLTSESAWDKHARIESHRVLRPLSRQLIYIYIWLRRYDDISI